MDDKKYRREMGLIVEDMDSLIASVTGIFNVLEGEISDEEEVIDTPDRNKCLERIERLDSIICALGDIKACLEDEEDG